MALRWYNLKVGDFIKVKFYGRGKSLNDPLSCRNRKKPNIVICKVVSTDKDSILAKDYDKIYRLWATGYGGYEGITIFKYKIFHSSESEFLIGGV